MPQYDAYMLRIWRSRAVRGRQWVARLDHLPGDESIRFTDPEALLAYLQRVVRAAEPVEPLPETLAGENVHERAPEEGGMQDRG